MRNTFKMLPCILSEARKLQYPFIEIPLKIGLRTFFKCSPFVKKTIDLEQHEGELQ